MGWVYMHCRTTLREVVRVSDYVNEDGKNFEFRCQ